MSPFRAVKYQLYLLQLENYDLGRFLRLVWLKGGWPKEVPRKKLVWTLKLAATFALALVLKILAAAGVASAFSGVIAVLSFFAALYVFSISFLIFLVMASILLRPLDFVLKTLIVARAKQKIHSYKNLKIIGIAGSYGKTTTKEVLRAILSIKYQVLAASESVNTPVGISRLILKELNSNIEIFIVEMGAYQRGDVKALCAITKPDIVVLTGINEAHLERFGSLENTIAAKFEIVENSNPGAIAVLNGDDENVKQGYGKHVEGRKALFYSKKDIETYEFAQDGSGIKFELPATSSQEWVMVPILGEYILGIISGSVMIAKDLGLTDEQIRLGISQVKPVPHRLEVLPSKAGILVIDDSYNGNPDGVREAIKVLAKFTTKRKIYITPGLVEMGKRCKEVHMEIGRQLVGVADVVVLIKNSVTPWIEEGIRSLSSSGERSETRGSILDSRLRGNGENRPEVIWFSSAREAHASVPKIVKVGDVMLFQNDWPDNYI